MKKHIFFTIAFLYIAFSAQAQIDRSKMPESGPTPSINLGKPYTFKMSNGVTVLVVENKKLPRISISLTLDNPPFSDGDKVGIADITSGIMGKGTQNISKDAFNEEVDFLGAFLNVSVGGGFTQSLSKYSERIVALFADASLNPIFTQEELDFEKKRLIDALKLRENSAEAIAGRVRNVLAYGKNHPAAEFPTETTINNISLQDVEAYYRTHFVPANAYMVISGDISEKKAKKLIKEHFSAWKSAKAPSVALPDVKDVQYRQINFIDVPNAVQTELAVMNISNLKLSDKDHHAALVANYILGGGFGSYINQNLREDKGYTYGARTVLPRNKDYKTAFRAVTKVRNMVTDSAVVETLKEIKRIKTEDVDATALENAKAKFLGDFILASENERTIAARSINIKTENLPEDFYETFIAKINAVTKEDIKRVANKYFNLDKSRIVLVGKGSDVLENLEKIQFDGKKIPINYFDKYGVPTEKPNYDKPLPEGLTVASVFDKYFEAIGGKENAKAVNSVHMIASAAAGGANLDIEFKRTSKAQFADIIKFGGNVVQKRAFNKENGYNMAQGQKIDFTSQEIEDSKIDALPFPELTIENAAIERIEVIDGKDTYVIKLREGKWAYFDAETGLKLREVTVRKAGGQEITSTLNLNDYKEVKGIKYPFKLTQSIGPQNIEVNISEIKVNEGISDEDFN